MFKELNDKTWLEDKILSGFSLTEIAFSVGCSVPAVSKACKRLNISVENSGRFQKGQKSANPNNTNNLTFKWKKGTKPSAFSFEGKSHTEDSKSRISENNWSRTEEGKKAASIRAQKMWKNRDHTFSDETRAKMSAARIGKAPVNKKGREAICAHPKCTNTLWISPSREGIKKYCSKECGLSDRDPEVISKTISKMHDALQDGQLISDPELRLGVFLLICGFDVYNQIEVGKYRADWLDAENGLDWECDEPYWHEKPEVKRRAANRDYVFRHAGYIRVGLEPKEIPSWEELSTLR